MKADFRIRKTAVSNGGFNYSTYRLVGWLNDRRIRKQFKSREEAEGEKARLEIQAANADQTIRPVNTRLSSQQVAEAEAAFSRLGGRSLAAAVDWFLTTYRPPVASVSMKVGVEAFLQDRRPHIRGRQLRDYKDSLRLFQTALPGRDVGSISTADVIAFLNGREIQAKRFNNLRGDLHAFFKFCQTSPQEWRPDNPVTVIQKRKVSRGLPEILNAVTATRLMAHLETYSGGPRSKQPSGFLVPYFALCLFAGLRPSIREGEIRKLADFGNLDRLIDRDVGVIRVTPEISKVGEVRQIKIQPNLAAWLLKFPPSKFPIVVPGMEGQVAAVRARFAIGPDVLRHTFISMHVARFRSIGDAALQAGNSEAMVRRHYLNLTLENDADAFWAISPGAVVGQKLAMSA